MNRGRDLVHSLDVGVLIMMITSALQVLMELNLYHLDNAVLYVCCARMISCIRGSKQHYAL